MRRWVLLLVLAGCSSDPTFDPPPPEAVASCSLVQKTGSRTYRGALWFDAASRLVQIDAFGPISVRLEYDAQDRVVRTSSRSGWTMWTYEPSRITSADSNGNTYLYDLDSNGLVAHYEGPEEIAPADRFRGDYQYDSAGHITSFTGATRWSETEGGPVMVSTFSHQFTYDDQGRVATSQSDREQVPVSYTYADTPGHLTINVTDADGGQFPWTYDLDDAGRVVHAEVPGFPGYKNAYSYTYVDDTITATADGSADSTVTATGALCPPVASTLAVDKPLTFNPLEQTDGHSTIWVPNPPVDAFAGYGL